MDITLLFAFTLTDTSAGLTPSFVSLASSSPFPFNELNWCSGITFSDTSVSLSTSSFLAQP
jgi:hypothetical protein